MSVKYLQINSEFSFGSVGRIMKENYDQKTKDGWECYIAYAAGTSLPGYRCIKIGNKFDRYLHAIGTRLFDKHGLYSRLATKAFLKKVEKINPDFIHLHNIHDYYLNYEVLFSWMKKHPNIHYFWTLHDCWAFTGHCSHFSAAKCTQWTTQCQNCPILSSYPKTIGKGNVFDNYQRKKEAFTGVKNLQIITVSHWLENLVKQSFLKEYPISVIYNPIDHSVFKPTPSSFRDQYHLGNRKVVLGVALQWIPSKGLADFIELSKMFGSKVQIVLVGLTKKQISRLPSNIIGLEKTNKITDLAGLYSTADVFVNPSTQETFGMTTLEAVSCGTKAVVYKGTACEEIVDKFGGIAVDQNIASLYEEIENLLFPKIA
jgi:putative colanic acid biosynthesis glycosyltransferase